MMDPIKQMMITDHHQQQQQNQNTVTVEEGMDCREKDSRFFILFNQETKLSIIISKTSSITSCKLNEHEIVVNNRIYEQNCKTWAIGDRPYQEMRSLPWNCHVRGAELLLSTTNGYSSLAYELNRFNELNCLAKLRSIHLQQQVVYFNLNNAKEKTHIDGHSLLVQCNGNLNRIQSKNTRLLCNCNKESPILPNSLIGDTPYFFTRNTSNNIPFVHNSEPQPTEDDRILCDAIFSLKSTSPQDILRVQLKYLNRSLTFETRSNLPLTVNNNSLNQNANVTSSNSKSDAITQDLRTTFDDQQASSSSGSHLSSKISSEKDNVESRKSKERCFDPMEFLQPFRSCSKGQNESNKNKISSSLNFVTTINQPSTILRVRVRITNFGVCIIPIMMTNYSCIYRFSC